MKGASMWGAAQIQFHFPFLVAATKWTARRLQRLLVLVYACLTTGSQISKWSVIKIENKKSKLASTSLPTASLPPLPVAIVLPKKWISPQMEILYYAHGRYCVKGKVKAKAVVRQTKGANRVSAPQAKIELLQWTQFCQKAFKFKSILASITAHESRKKTPRLRFFHSLYSKKIW